jgi:hypothetical protein
MSSLNVSGSILTTASSITGIDLTGMAQWVNGGYRVYANGQFISSSPATPFVPLIKINEGVTFRRTEGITIKLW